MSLYTYADGLPVVLSPEQCMAVDYAIRNYTEHVVVTENRTPDPPEIAHWFRTAVVEQRGPMYLMLIKGEFPYQQPGSHWGGNRANPDGSFPR